MFSKRNDDLMLYSTFFSRSSHVLCGSDPSQLVPIGGTTNEGTPFEFTVTFTTSSSDGNTSDGFSLVLISKMNKNISLTIINLCVFSYDIIVLIYFLADVKEPPVSTTTVITTSELTFLSICC